MVTLKRTGIVLGCIAGIILFIYVGILIAVENRRVVTRDLEQQGYSDVRLSAAWYNRSPWTCSGKNTVLFTYTARKNGNYVSGFACYQGWPWAVHHWDD